mgnify:CR=1 FL=1
MLVRFFLLQIRYRSLLEMRVAFVLPFDYYKLKGFKMFFKTSTVYKGFATRKGAENYIARFNLSSDTRIEIINDRFWVVG